MLLMAMIIVFPNKKALITVLIGFIDPLIVCISAIIFHIRTDCHGKDSSLLYLHVFSTFEKKNNRTK